MNTQENLRLAQQFLEKIGSSANGVEIAFADGKIASFLMREDSFPTSMAALH